MTRAPAWFLERVNKKNIYGVAYNTFEFAHTRFPDFGGQ